MLLVHVTKTATTSNRADHADGYARLFELYYTRLPSTPEARDSYGSITYPSSGYNFLDVNVTSLENRLKASLPISTYAGGEAKGPHFLCDPATPPLSRDGASALSGKHDDDEYANLEKPYAELALHGILLGLQYCLQDPDLYAQPTQSLIRRILNVCSTVWNNFKRRVSIDSPETANEDIHDNPIAGPRDMLAYSWRAVRDSSLLLRAILESRYFTDRTLPSSAVLSDYKRVSNSFNTQLQNWFVSLWTYCPFYRDLISFQG